MPPLDVTLYRALLSISIAVLDPFPVGLHIQLIDAIDSNIPIVTAPMLQECTARHGLGLLRAANRGHGSIEEYPQSVEDYAVYALSLQQNVALRSLYIVEETQSNTNSNTNRAINSNRDTNGVSSSKQQKQKQDDRVDRLNNILNQRKKKKKLISIANNNSSHVNNSSGGAVTSISSSNSLKTNGKSKNTDTKTNSDTNSDTDTDSSIHNGDLIKRGNGHGEQVLKFIERLMHSTL